MIDLIRMVGVYFLFLSTCYVLGVTTLRLVKLPQNFILTILVGFFSLFAVFQIVALPIILKKKSLTFLNFVWNVVWIIMIVGLVFWNRKHLLKTVGKLQKRSIKEALILLVILVATLLECIMQIGYNYWGWDTAYYIATVNTSLQTDTMYLYDGTSGLLEEKMQLRYALSSYYMYAAVLCKTFGLHPLLYFRYFAGIICIVFSNLISYQIGKVLFINDKMKQKFFVLLYIMLSFLWVSDYSNADFLIRRGYESKGYCANVIIPMLFLLFLLIFKNGTQKRKKIWLLVFLVSLASVPISMSSLLIVPIMVFVITVTCFVMDRDWHAVRMGILCVFPNLAYAGVYFLYAKDILVIGV